MDRSLTVASINIFLFVTRILGVAVSVKKIKQNSIKKKRETVESLL